ncbi:MAG TPA: imidazoleglycerol-phosphate dehydratase HisB [Ignavibacteria bacterium]|nr:imidazoleglycerol-phosphate dehydratase HisB [Ignavibacteria bacterium]
MNKIIIDKKFLDLSLPISGGLITGLKNLSKKGFELSIENFGSLNNDTLKKLFELEGINIIEDSLKNSNKTYFITTQNIESELAFIVKENTKVDNFEKAVSQLLTSLRTASENRKTKETDVKVEVSLDGSGEANINTGIGFFDHMLEQLAKHANINLVVNVKGDLIVDEHHTVEDVAITLGSVINNALGNKTGIKRYGYFLPMDDAIARCSIDLGGRIYLNFKVKFKREKVGDFPTELTEEFFKGLASGLKANIFIRAKAKNDHHKIEAIFKAFAKSLNEACRLDERNQGVLPSTKGVL